MGWRTVVILLLCAALAACSDSDDSGLSASGSTALCVNSACGRARQIVDLPDLENVEITANGRTFVSGQQNLYEITGDAGGAYAAQPLLAPGSGCSGLAANGNWLYALCPGQGGPGDAGLYVMDAATPGDAPQPIFSLAGMTLPNGMVWDDVGHALYVTDGPVALEPKIVRLALDPSDPRQVHGQTTWLALPLQYPNGLALHGRSLYTTLYTPGLGGAVARIEIRPDGTPGPVSEIFAAGIMDDLSTAGDSLLVTDWQGGAILQLALDGTRLQGTEPMSFSQPSAVLLAHGPLFRPGDVLVTERYLGRGLWLFSATP